MAILVGIFALLLFINSKKFQLKLNKQLKPYKQFANTQNEKNDGKQNKANKDVND